MEDFPLEQSWDNILPFAFDQVRSIDGQLVCPDAAPSHPYFLIIIDLLYRMCCDTQTGELVTHFLVRKSCRKMVFQATFYHPSWDTEPDNGPILLAVHLGRCKWYASCPECQLVNNLAMPKGPLRPLPLVEVPFNRVAMDLISPFDQSTQVHTNVTRYLEAVPLRNISSESVSHVLFQIISYVGIPKEILTDQGTSFMSLIRCKLYKQISCRLFDHLIQYFI